MKNICGTVVHMYIHVYIHIYTHVYRYNRYCMNTCGTGSVSPKIHIKDGGVHPWYMMSD